MNPRGIVTAGTWCFDRLRLIDHWPAEDSVATARTVSEQGGGCARNLAVALRRLDPAIPVSTIGLAGDDEAGRKMRAEIDDAGINGEQFRLLPDWSTHMVDAFQSETLGLRTHISEIGASAALTPAHADFTRARGRFLHLGLPGLHPIMDAPWDGEPSGWVAVLRAARAAGMRTNLELCTLPAPTLRALVLPCLPHLDLLVVNDREIGALAGREIEAGNAAGIRDAAAAAASLLALGATELVVVHFPLGAVAARRDAPPAFVPSVAVPADAVAGPNGAGDAFAAGLLYGLHEDWPLERALALAHATAAASLRHVSTTDTIVPWRDCLDLAAASGLRPHHPLS